MRLHNRALVAVILSLAGFYSCSRQATIPTQLTYTPVPVFTIPDSLLATSPIEYAFYKAEPGHRSVSFRRNRQNDRLEPGLWQRSRRASLQRPGNGIRP